jgi:hypothetical protein
MRLEEGLVLLLLKVVNVSLESIVTVSMETKSGQQTHVFDELNSTHAMYSSHHSTWALNLREELDNRESQLTG